MEKHENHYVKNKGITLGYTADINKQIKYFDGKIVFEYLIVQYNKNQEMSNFTITAFALYSIANIFSPAILRLYVG
jgi:hypothetical protein